MFCASLWRGHHTSQNPRLARLKLYTLTQTPSASQCLVTLFHKCVTLSVATGEGSCYLRRSCSPLGSGYFAWWSVLLMVSEFPSFIKWVTHFVLWGLVILHGGVYWWFRDSLPLLSEWHVLFIPSSTDRYLHGFPHLTRVDNTSTNTSMQMLFKSLWCGRAHLSWGERVCQSSCWLLSCPGFLCLWTVFRPHWH